MAAEIERLRSQQTKGPLPNQWPVEHPNTNFGPLAANANPAAGTLQRPPTASPADDLSLPESSSTNASFARLGGHCLTSDDVALLFQIFFDRLHPHRPILDSTIPSTVLLQCSPILFWTVIVVVRQHFWRAEADEDSNCQLREKYVVLLRETMLTAPLSLHSIQAIVLICTWPLPVIRFQITEPSWLYAGVAVNAAKTLSLDYHGAQYRFHGAQLSQKDVENMARTYVGVFIASTSLAIFLGWPPSIRSTDELSAIVTLISQQRVPRALAAEASIFLILTQHRVIASPELETVAYEGLTRNHLQRLRKLKSDFADIWEQRFELLLQAAQLHLHMGFFASYRSRLLDATVAHLGVHDDTLILASSVACQTIEVFCKVAEGDSEAYTPGREAWPVATLPKQAALCAMHAVVFLIRYICFSPDHDEEKQQRACHSVLKCRDTLRWSSTQPLDERARAAAMIDILFKSSDTWKDQAIQIDDRGSASIYWDAIHKSYKVRGRSTRRTDLLDLIDPTRTLNPESHIPASSTNVDQESLAFSMEDEALWNEMLDESITNMFNMEMFWPPG